METWMTLLFFDDSIRGTCSYADHWYEGAGWYYADETEQLNGPFASKEDAGKACQVYADNLDRSHVVDDVEVEITDDH